MLRYNKLPWVLPIGLLVLGVSVAAAGDISNTIFRIEATNDIGTGFQEFFASDLVFQPATNSWNWVAPAQTQIMQGANVLAVLESATLRFIKDPQANKPYYIDLTFALQAGGGASPTHFRVLTGQISFPALPVGVAAGRSTAAFNISDTDSNGATLEGWGPPGTGAYTAQYNGAVPGGTTFANLVNLIQAGPGGSGSGGQQAPPAGYDLIGTPVQDMSLMLDFTLTPTDIGGGTESYRILPEPTSLGLMALSALALAFRRR